LICYHFFVWRIFLKSICCDFVQVSTISLFICILFIVYFLFMGSFLSDSAETVFKYIIIINSDGAGPYGGNGQGDFYHSRCAPSFISPHG
jgi:hypothetical protein